MVQTLAIKARNREAKLKARKRRIFNKACQSDKIAEGKRPKDISNNNRIAPTITKSNPKDDGAKAISHPKNYQKTIVTNGKQRGEASFQPAILQFHIQRSIRATKEARAIYRYL